MMAEEQIKILKMLEAGQISTAEAAQLLAALDPASERQQEREQDEQGERGDPAPTEWTQSRGEYQEAPGGPGEKWRGFWVYPLLAGGVVLFVGALVVSLVYATRAGRGWLLCGWPPLFVGLAIMLLAFWARQATWMHLRVQEEGKRKIAFSFPLPLALAAWAVRLAQPFVPQLQESGVDDLIIALRASGSRGEPFFIDVQDDENGERVQLYIG
jgi:hypothetical protein